MRTAIITFYNDFSVGVNVLSSLLTEHGHPVGVFFFKVPSVSQVNWFAENTREYMEVINHQGDILAGNAVTNRWTDTEVNLLVDELEKFDPDLLCFSSRTQDDPLAAEVYPVLRKRFQNCVTMAGGFGPSINIKHYALLVDYVFVGEAEGVICDLVDKLERGESLRDVDNMAFMDGETLVKNRLGCPGALKFSKQIFPNNVIYIDRNQVFSKEREKEIAKPHCYSTFLGRGCVQSCSYCAAGHWQDMYKQQGYTVPKRRNRPVDDVIEELAELRNRDVTFVHIRDEYMTGPRNFMLDFFEKYEKRVGLPFWCYLVPQQIVKYPEILQAAVDAGFVDTEIGFQSGSDEINRTVFTRKLRHEVSVEYCHMLASYDINMKYDFIVFNPAERQEHVQQTYDLIRLLPKKRSYIFMPRLFYYDMVPINDILSGVRVQPEEFEAHYIRALSYLLCFVTDKADFEEIMADPAISGDWCTLKAFYQALLKERDITFNVGTHEVPDSITTPRYGRIIEKNNFLEAVVWGDESYFEPMRHVFPEPMKLHFMGNFTNGHNPLPVEALDWLNPDLPVFVCTADKQKARAYFNAHHSGRSGQVYV